MKIESRSVFGSFAKRMSYSSVGVVVKATLTVMTTPGKGKKMVKVVLEMVTVYPVYMMPCIHFVAVSVDEKMAMMMMKMMMMMMRRRKRNFRYWDLRQKTLMSGFLLTTHRYSTN